MGNGLRACPLVPWYDFRVLFFILQVSCGKCGNPLGHEFIGDGPDKKGRMTIMICSSELFLALRNCIKYLQGQDFESLATP